MKKELWRQLIHASGVFIVFLSYILPPKVLIILCVAILAFVILIFHLDHHHHIPFFSTIFRIAKRDEDEIGFIYFFIGIILTLSLFQFNMGIANAAILILLFGDSASTLIGRRWGKMRLSFQPKKTLEGSLAFLVVSLVVSLTQVPLVPALAGAIGGTITEAYSPIDDNITIPLISALVMSAVIYLL
ncbi:MAG: hypothetical protein PWQ15_1235 [Methanobacterium sp.]|jgi:dolichol kinase|uniref:diacylglycerol/polyprenol kinase family protein n=1 Tax=Methanobacterium sp. TaxID=2164 RepID=UPI0003C9CFB2|nr:diacylglycerol/polyprenol kinase family protein [Methanobacterium sp.]MDI3550132.1 hypothetical protein [Methanobacterium sp.]CDG66042.1 phosphatidate cytidylyltransferase [Methanobacterium sp. MB1]